MSNSVKTYRGSRKHILDWTNKANFLYEFQELHLPIDINLTSNLLYAPQGYSQPKEIRLKDWKASEFHQKYKELESWWLTHFKGANTPNWDLVIECIFKNRPTLILVEAKAHSNELSQLGKALKVEASRNSIENHQKISSAIVEANNSLLEFFPEINISIDSHYQLTNRIAYSWKLATMGFNVILIYLGFTGDKGITDVGEPIKDQLHWQYIMQNYTKNILPDSFFDKWITCGSGSMFMSLKSQPVIDQSKPRGA